MYYKKSQHLKIQYKSIAKERGAKVHSFQSWNILHDAPSPVKCKVISEIWSLIIPLGYSMTFEQQSIEEAKGFFGKWRNSANGFLANWKWNDKKMSTIETAQLLSRERPISLSLLLRFYCLWDFVCARCSYYAAMSFSCMATSTWNGQAYLMIYLLIRFDLSYWALCSWFCNTLEKILSIPWNIARAMLIREWWRAQAKGELADLSDWITYARL